jgi:hypothetical protein
MKLMKNREGPTLRISSCFVEVRTVLRIEGAPWLVVMYIDVGRGWFWERIVVNEAMMNHLHWQIYEFSMLRYSNGMNVNDHTINVLLLILSLYAVLAESITG